MSEQLVEAVEGRAVLRRGVLAHPVTQTLAEATRFRRVGMKALGDDVLIEYVR